MALYLYTVANIKEQVQREVASPTLKESFGTLFRNRPLLWLCVGSLAFLTGMTALQTLAAYYAIYVQDDAQYIAWNAVAQTVGTFVSAAFIPAIVRTLGKRNGYLVLGLVGVLAGGILAVAPQSLPGIAVLGFFVVGVGLGGVNTLMWALEADTVEYGEWKTNVRTEGTTYALFSFTRKMGQAIGGAAGAYALGLVAFDSVAATEGAGQSQATIDGVQLWTGLLASGFMLLSVLIMMMYPLTDKVFREIVADIAARRLQHERTEPVGPGSDR
jgi:glucuronide carrier protein